MPILTKVEYFDDDGRKISDMMYYGNRPVVGEEVVLDEDENLLARIPYSHGKKHGVERIYWPDGMLSMRIHWRKGKQEGRQIETDEKTGEISRVTEWREGKLHGEEKVFSGGRLVRTVDWRWGKKHGREIAYWPSGEPRDVFFWERGRRILRRLSYSRSGKPLNAFGRFLNFLFGSGR